MKLTRHLRRVAILALIFATILSTMSVFGYEHSASLYAGNKGTISDNDVTGKVIKVNDDNATLDIDGSTDLYTLDDSKYYIRGIKYAGQDNDLCYRQIDATNLDEDVELVDDFDHFTQRGTDGFGSSGRQ